MRLDAERLEKLRANAAAVHLDLAAREETAEQDAAADQLRILKRRSRADFFAEQTFDDKYRSLVSHFAEAKKQEEIAAEFRRRLSRSSDKLRADLAERERTTAFDAVVDMARAELRTQRLSSPQTDPDVAAAKTAPSRKSQRDDAPLVFKRIDDARVVSNFLDDVDDVQLMPSDDESEPPPFDAPFNDLQVDIISTVIAALRSEFRSEIEAINKDERRQATRRHRRRTTQRGRSDARQRQWQRSQDH
jgi:hypothetical protein